MVNYLWGSSIDWSYETQPQAKACKGRKKNVCLWPRGKVMGGCSSINLMMYIRGNKNDYDNWAYLGNPGWSYNEVLPYFMKSEDNKNLQVNLIFIIKSNKNLRKQFLNIFVRR